MPSLYAHNKFGKKVIKDLPEILKNIVKKYPDAFRIGLQGPDTLFFYKALYKNKINQIGVDLHHKDVYDFFNQALSVVCAKGFDSESHSYLLGFICHYALDHACHPYIYEAMNETGCGHIEIEGDFDQYLLTSDGKIPHEYRMDKLVPTQFSIAASMAPFYPDVPVTKIHTSLIHMKMLKRFFVAPGKIKRNTIDNLMKATFHYKFFKGHVIFPWANDKCRHCSEELYTILLDAVPFANKLIADFEISLLRGTPLPNNFHGDFTGKPLEKSNISNKK